MFTIGSDPEFFITNGAGSVVPIVGLLGGTKEEPFQLGGGFAYQEDNVMAEYNIPPATDYQTFANHIVHGRSLALNKVRETYPKAAASKQSSVLFSQEHLATPQAQMFGCSPDFNAYEQGRPLPRINPELLMRGTSAWRFAGGHIHLGYKDALTWQVPEFVVAAMCDLLISIPMIVNGFDEQGERRRFYGSPGRFRPTKYGIEYRTLSNKWTMTERSAMIAGLCALNTMHELARGEAHIRAVYNEMPWHDVRRTISNEDMGEARRLRDHFRAYGLEAA